MTNQFFSGVASVVLNKTVEELERIKGTDVYSKLPTVVYANGCDHWDCFGKCYCAQSWKD